MRYARYLVSILLACAMIVCIWRAADYISLRSSSARLVMDLQQAEAMILEMDRLAKLPATALAPGTSDTRLLDDLQKVFSEAGVSSGSIRDLTIDPRIDDRSVTAGSGLSRRSGRANCVGLTLPQLGRVLSTLRKNLPPVTIDQLSISKEPNTSDPPQFRVSLTFAAYAPLSQASNRIPAPVLK